jgi:polar amino acid transport system substrate-binding protein
MKTKGISQLWPSLKAIHIVNLLSAAVLLAALDQSGMNSCLAQETPQSGAAVSSPPLRVGITPEYPPLVFRQPDGTNGLEIDFAKALGQELGRPVEFVVLRWDELIDSLLARRIDIIMSGMSITKARQLRIGFSDPYVRNELRAIFPVKEAARFKTAEDLLKTEAKIGVVAGTTADVFVKQHCTNAKVVPVTMRKDVAVFLLQTKRFDVFVDDSFALADILSKNEADLAYLPQALSEDDLAWGVRPDDAQFLAKVNSILSKWKSDGTLDRLLDRWMPYLKNLRVQQPAGQTR